MSQWRRILLVLAVVTLVAGSIAAVRIGEFLSGGGTQPSAYIPANVSAAAVLDLDPALGQKLAILSLARHFPKTKKATNKDLGNNLATSVLPDCLGSPKDVRAWVGSRVAIAFRAPSVDPLLVVQIKAGHAGRARGTLARLATCSHGRLTGVIRGHYVLASSSPALLAESSALPQSASLNKAPTYKSDLKTLHGDQIFTVWGDGAQVRELLSEFHMPLISRYLSLLPVLHGRAMAGFHANKKYGELELSTIGVSISSGSTGPSAISSVPGTSMAAVYAGPTEAEPVNRAVTRYVPKSLLTLSALTRLIGLPSLTNHLNADGSRVLTLGPTFAEDVSLRSLALAELPGAPLLVAYARLSAIPGVPSLLDPVRAVGLVVTTSGSARLRIVV